MRHRTKGRKLNRTASHRKALLRNLANQLIEHKEIKTTTAKAKEARSTVERLITYAKKVIYTIEDSHLVFCGIKIRLKYYLMNLHLPIPSVKVDIQEY